MNVLCLYTSTVHRNFFSSFLKKLSRLDWFLGLRGKFEYSFLLSGFL